MKVLITGATGFLGSQIARHFLKSPDFLKANGSLVLHGRSEKRLSQLAQTLGASVKTWVADLGTEVFLKDGPPPGITHLIHTAALDQNQSVKDPKLASYILGTATDQLLGRLSTQSLSHVFFLSTRWVYGPFRAGAHIFENEPTAPANAYGESHLVGEATVARHLEKNLKGAILRLSNTVGAPVLPDANCWWLAVNDFCRSAFERGRIQIQSDGSPERDFVSVASVTSFLETLIFGSSNRLDSLRSLSPQWIVHFGSGHHQTVLELAAQVRSVALKRLNKKVGLFLKGQEVDEKELIQLLSIHHSNLPHRPVYKLDRARSLGYTSDSTSLTPAIEEIFNFLETQSGS